MKIDNKIIEAAGALIYSLKTKRFLWLLRSEISSYPNTWGLVGGKKESGENNIECLEREIYEEIGFHLISKKIIPLETYTSSDTNFFYYTYIVIVDDEFIPELNEEHNGYCWCPLKSHPQPLHPGLWHTVKVESIQEKIKLLEEIY
jgi:8-oxo-dGTP pyrophosphatase MutT (NUDIX family)